MMLYSYIRRFKKHVFPPIIIRIPSLKVDPGTRLNNTKKFLPESRPCDLILERYHELFYDIIIPGKMSKIDFRR